MRRGPHIFRAVLALLAVVATSASMAAEEWPARPVKLVVPSSPGGGTDTFGRLLAQALTEAMGQQFVVDNRPGASGSIGASIVAKAEPDGYTFLVASNSSLAVNPALYNNLPFDVERDLVPVTRGVFAPMVIAVHPSTGAKTLGDLIALGRRDPGRLAYGSAGNGSPLYLGVRMLEEATGARFLHVPYKGVGPAYQDLLSGRTQFMFTDLATALSHIRAGKIRALAVNQRTPLLPDTPTLADVGWPSVDIYTSFSVMAPANTPQAIVRRMHAEIARAMHGQALATKLNAQALVPVFDTPEEFAVSLKKERERWASFIRRNNITVD